MMDNEVYITKDRCKQIAQPNTYMHKKWFFYAIFKKKIQNLRKKFPLYFSKP